MAALFGDRVQSVFLVGGRLLAVVELVVQPDDPFLKGQSVRALSIDYRLLPMNLVRGDRSLTGPPQQGRLAPGDRLIAIAALPDLERLLRRERVTAEWAVDVTSFPLPARPQLAQLLGLYQSVTAEEADKQLERLPVCLGNHLTRGQAEELIEQLGRERVTTQLRQSSGEPCRVSAGSGEQ
jgi:hypothetical protein